MAYIKVLLGKQERQLTFNMGAVDAYWKKLMLTEIGSSVVYATFYAGLVGNCIAEGEQADFTYREVIGWVDDLYLKGGEETIKKVCDEFAELEVYKHELAKKAALLRTFTTEVEGKVIKKKKTSPMISS